MGYLSELLAAAARRARRLVNTVEDAQQRSVRWTQRADSHHDAVLTVDAAKVDLILEYALAVASEADGAFERQLGRIHLLKYVYLADVAYAEKAGATFTGTRWRFYHYGPWEPAVNARIDRVVAHTDIAEHAWQSARYESDTIRWSMNRDHAQDRIREMESKLPISVTLAVRRAVRSFGDDTSSLLHHVYTTVPMLHAAPGQVLDFTIVKKASDDADTASSEPEKELTTKERKKRREAMLKLKSKFSAAAMLSASGRKLKRPTLEPIYDEIFRAGAEQIEALAGASPEGISGDAHLSDDIWTSEIRKRGRLP